MEVWIAYNGDWTKETTFYISQEAALEAAKTKINGWTFQTAKVRLMEFRNYPVNTMLEDYETEVQDAHGEFASDWPVGLTVEMEGELEEMIHKVFHDWLTKHNLYPLEMIEGPFEHKRCEE